MNQACSRNTVLSMLPVISLPLQEHLQHKAEVVQALYSPDGARLYTAGADGGLCVYDVAQVYMPVKFLSAGQRDLRVSACDITLVCLTDQERCSELMPLQGSVSTLL
jgi:hypothetical protein